MKDKIQKFTEQLTSLFDDEEKREETKEQALKSLEASHREKILKASRYLADKLDDIKVLSFFEELGISKKDIEKAYTVDTELLLTEEEEGVKKIFNECQATIFGIDTKKIKGEEEIKEIEKEFAGGDNYCQKLTAFINKLPQTDIIYDDYTSITRVRPCEQ